MKRLGDWLSAFLGVGLAIVVFVMVPVIVIIVVAGVTGIPPSVGVVILGLVVLAAAALLTLQIRRDRSYRERYPEETLRISTRRPSRAQAGDDTVDELSGRDLAEALAEAINMDAGGCEVEERIAEESGWGFWVRSSNSDNAIWLGVRGLGDDDQGCQEFRVTTSPRSGCNPATSVDAEAVGALEAAMQRAVRNHLTVNDLAFTVEKEDEV